MTQREQRTGSPSARSTRCGVGSSPRWTLVVDRWEEYTATKEAMFAHRHHPPWITMRNDRSARLNAMGVPQQVRLGDATTRWSTPDPLIVRRGGTRSATDAGCPAGFHRLGHSAVGARAPPAPQPRLRPNPGPPPPSMRRRAGPRPSRSRSSPGPGSGRPRGQPPTGQEVRSGPGARRRSSVITDPELIPLPNPRLTAAATSPGIPLVRVSAAKLVPMMTMAGTAT